MEVKKNGAEKIVQLVKYLLCIIRYEIFPKEKANPAKQTLPT